MLIPFVLTTIIMIFIENIMIFYKICFCYCSNTLNFDTFDRVLFHALYFLYHHYDQMEVILSVNRIKLKLEYCRYVFKFLCRANTI